MNGVSGVVPLNWRVVRVFVAFVLLYVPVVILGRITAAECAQAEVQECLTSPVGVRHGSCAYEGTAR